jgi:hypothetical protein
MLSTTILSTRQQHTDTVRQLVKLQRKGFPELQGSSMLQPQQVTVFPAEHMFTIVMYGLRPNVCRHHICVSVCVLLTSINVLLCDSTLSICQTEPILGGRFETLNT